MKRASVSEAKNNLSALLDRVKSGASVLIVDRGRPVARLQGIAGDPTSGDDRLARLVRDGVVRPGRTPFPAAVLKTKPPRSAGASALRTLVDERRKSR